MRRHLTAPAGRHVKRRVARALTNRGVNRIVRPLLERGVGNRAWALLETTGRKSGEPRTSPLIFARDGDDYLIVASVGGMPKHPAWYLNVRDRPEDVAVEIKGTRTPVAVRHATAAERERLMPALLEMWPAWEDYARRTDREFPVLLLTPQEP